MAFTSNFNLPTAVYPAWKIAYPNKTTYVALRDECVKRGIDDAKIRALAVKHGTTITAICRKILVADKPDLAAAWPPPTHTPSQMIAHHKRAFIKDVTDVAPEAMQAARILRALMIDADSSVARRAARRWLEEHAGIKRVVHTDIADLPPLADLTSGDSDPEIV